MKQADYERFSVIAEDLALKYRRKPQGAEEIVAYFETLIAIPLAVVEAAAQRAPAVYVSFFPTAGEWLALCEQVLAERRDQRGEDARDAHLAMARCVHAYETEAVGGDQAAREMFTAFRVCQKCGHTVPVLNRAGVNAARVKYLQMGLQA